MLLVYLFSATTGLWWSYGWANAAWRWALTGQTAEAAQQRGAGRGRPDGADHKGPPSLDAAWKGFLDRSTGRYSIATILVPRGPAAEVRIRVVAEHAPNPHASDEYRMDAATGALKQVSLYADRSYGEAIAGNFLEFHRGRFFGLAGSSVVMLASACMPLFAVTGLLLYLGRRRSKRRATIASREPIMGALGDR